MQLITDCDMGILGEVHLKIDYDHERGEAMQPNPDLPGFGPGCDEGFDVTQVQMLVGGVYIDISDLVEEDTFTALAELCEDDYHSGDEE